MHLYMYPYTYLKITAQRQLSERCMARKHAQFQINMKPGVCACASVSYGINFSFYASVNEHYLNKATAAHKSVRVEMEDLLKILHFKAEPAHWQQCQLKRPFFHTS